MKFSIFIPAVMALAACQANELVNQTATNATPSAAPTASLVSGGNWYVFGDLGCLIETNPAFPQWFGPLEHPKDYPFNETEMASDFEMVRAINGKPNTLPIAVKKGTNLFYVQGRENCDTATKAVYGS